MDPFFLLAFLGHVCTIDSPCPSMQCVFRLSRTSRLFRHDKLNAIRCVQCMLHHARNAPYCAYYMALESVSRRPAHHPSGSKAGAHRRSRNRVRPANCFPLCLHTDRRVRRRRNSQKSSSALRVSLLNRVDTLSPPHRQVHQPRSRSPHRPHTPWSIRRYRPRVKTRS